MKSIADADRRNSRKNTNNIAENFWADHDALVAEWVKGNSVRPELAIGDKVIASLNQEGDTEGEITRILENRGQYIVCCPSLGHVKDSKKSGEPHGVLVDYEKVRPLTGG